MKTFVATCKCGWMIETDDKKRAEVLADVHETKARVAHKHATRVDEGFLMNMFTLKPVRVIDTNWAVSK